MFSFVVSPSVSERGAGLTPHGGLGNLRKQSLKIELVGISPVPLGFFAVYAAFFSSTGIQAGTLRQCPRTSVIVPVAQHRL
jgi:hypothetical protein